MPSSAATGAALRRMTDEEWSLLDEDESGELVDGVLEEEEIPTALHEMIALWLASLMRGWVAPRGGVVFGSELKLRVRAGLGRKADASVYLPGRALPAKLLGATGRAPSIVIEVPSPRPRDVPRDLVDKVAEYAAFGVITTGSSIRWPAFWKCASCTAAADT